MKKILFLKLLVLVACLSSALSATAYDFVSGGIYYNITGTNTVEVTYKDTNYNTYPNSTTGTSISIPTSVRYNGTTYYVRAIGNSAFRNCSSTNFTVTLTSNITEIGDYAFYDSAIRYLPSENYGLDVPNSVTRIGNYAFYGCYRLGKITFNYATTTSPTIGSHAFDGCSALETVTIPANFSSIGSYAFANCSDLEYFHFSSSNLSIGSYAFYNSTSLRGIYAHSATPPTIQSTTFTSTQYSNVTVWAPTPGAMLTYQAANYWSQFRNYGFIRAWDFISSDGLFYYAITGSNTIKLQSLTDDGKASIGFVIGPYDTYEGQTYYLTEIGSDACSEQTKLTYVTLIGESRLTKIDDAAFYHCTNLTYVKLNNAPITEIGRGAFLGCPLTRGFEIYNSTPPTISDNTFSTSAYNNCTVTVAHPQDVTTYKATNYWRNFVNYDFIYGYDFKVDNIYYRKTGANTVSVSYYLRWYDSYTGEVTIPLTVTYDGTTYNVTGITDYAFNGELPDSKLNSNGTDLRVAGNGLKRVTVGNNVNTIGNEAFGYNNRLASVTLGTGVTSIGANMFTECSNLAAIISKRTTPPTIQSNTFNTDIYNNVTLYVHTMAALNNYKAANYWKNFANIKVIPSFNEILNAPGGDINFTSTGSYPWMVMVDGDGIYAMSGNSGVHSSTSTLTATVTVPDGGAPVSFDFKAWGEGSSYDKCVFSVDGTQQFSYGARQNNWETYTVDLSAGTHTLTWTYSKDGSVNPTGDYFAVRNVKLNFDAYAVYTSSNTTLTFYYDNKIQFHGDGTLYLLNDADNAPEWSSDGICGDVTKVVFDPSFANARPTSTRQWFATMVNLASITGISYLNTEDVTSMQSMFWECRKLTSIDVSGFNTAKVTEMYGMFNDCFKLTTIYAGSGWTTAAVTSSSKMFTNCTNLVGGRGTTYSSSHTDKAYAHIDGGTSNPGYFTAAGTEAYASYTPSNTTLTFYYDNLRSTRTGTTYDLNTGTNKPVWVTDSTCRSVTKVVFNSSFATARPTSTFSWFRDMPNLTSITGIIYLNTENVTHMGYMFYGCSSLTNLNVSNFNTANVTNMGYMFNGCSGLTSLYVSAFNTAKVTNMSYMFQNCKSLTSLDVSNFNTTMVTNFANMFRNCRSLTSLDVSNFNTAKVTNFANMFSTCTGLTSLDVSNFNTAQAKYMDFMFDGSSGLTSLDVSNFNTANVTSMNYMFRGCTGLTSLDLSHFNTGKVESMKYMFYGCSNLTTIYAGDEWTTDAVTSSDYMFSGCTSLVGGAGTTYDANHVNADYAHVDGGPSNPGYLTASGQTGDVNGDGKTTIADVTALINYLLSGEPTAGNCDVNGDSKVTIADVTALINQLLSSN